VFTNSLRLLIAAWLDAPQRRVRLNWSGSKVWSALSNPEDWTRRYLNLPLRLTFYGHISPHSLFPVLLPTQQQQTDTSQVTKQTITSHFTSSVV